MTKSPPYILRNIKSRIKQQVHSKLTNRHFSSQKGYINMNSSWEIWGTQKINALAKIYTPWLSLHCGVMFLLCFFPGPPSRVFIIYDQGDDKLDRCTMQRPSLMQQFFLEGTSGSTALFPLETQRLWTWLAAWLASQLWRCISSCFWHKLSLDIWLYPSTASPSPFTWDQP